MPNISIVVISDCAVVRVGLQSILNDVPEIDARICEASVLEVKTYVRKIQADLYLIDSQISASLFKISADIKDADPRAKMILIAPTISSDLMRSAERMRVNGLVSFLGDGDQILEAVQKVGRGDSFFPSDAEPPVLKKTMQNQQNSHPLSPREVDVLCCVAKAMTAKEIATDLKISVKTVDRHKANIMNKLRMRSQIELARYAIRNRFVDV